MTRKLPYLEIEKYKDSVDIEINEEELPLADQRILKKISNVNGLLCCVTDKVNKQVLEFTHNLRVICNYAGDYANIDLREATNRGIFVTYLPGEAFYRAVAELTMGLLITTVRRIAESDRFIRQGKWKGWSPNLFMGKELNNKVLGVIGLGRIGEHVTKLAKGFDMRVVYYDIVKKSLKEERELGVEYVSLEKLLRNSDFITIHVPLNEKTRYMINEDRLRLMKKSAYVLNTSRGGIVDENALYKILKEGRIGGAALDVFEEEPANERNPLFELENVVLTPHIGGATEEVRKIETEFAINEIITVLRGDIPKKLANPEVLRTRTRQKNCSHDRN